ncbi:c-type cytochrome [Mucilaginibacter robiniae]|uniref:C-type cytochrome n=1 Tax=Mucilaginibacter robiniae TaxID=2728022 RepID=A0A7L5DY86_9SPHI|nr:c-type cytochrome [Mucilaginibacter robiniae]QJD96060.1 c-type cytochrome [Mucilaginibacter robiniae]
MEEQTEQEVVRALVKITRYTIYIAVLLVACIAIIVVSLSAGGRKSAPVVAATAGSGDTPVSAPTTDAAAPAPARPIPADAWKAPDTSTIPAGKSGEMIRYGRELVAHTSNYFGPKGSIAMLTNGMNCQNCHLDGGSRLFGNNYASFMASYPKLSNRSGHKEPASERLVECFERSLAGKAPDTNGREVRSILAYMKWIGRDVKKGQKLFGSASEKLPFMDVAANPAKGQVVYLAKCQSCHGAGGEGMLAADKKSYTYPPLWGKHSFNDGAGMYRITNMAGFVKNNMPYGATYQDPQLSDEEAWNVAAYIESMPRPHKDQHGDWKDLSKKPIDFPFGPYADQFSQQQHKYGPFQQIKAAQKKTSDKS